MQRGMADSRPGLLMVWALVAAALMINSAIAQDAVDCSECPSGKYLASECDIVEGNDRKCSSCEDRCGKGATDCKATGDGGAHCKSCNFDVQIPIFILDVDGDGYGECKFCTTCPTDHYMKTPCSGTSDNVCKSCSVCDEDQTVLSACTATEDTQCSKEEKKEKDEGKDKKKDKKKNKDKEEEETAELSILAADEPDVDCGDCPDGKYVSRECNVDKGRGRECSSCEDHCGDGVDKCKDVDGTVECESCNYKSAFPVFVKDEDGDGYGPCSFCTPCGSDQYLEEACEGTKDNVCKDCSVCKDGEILKSACTETEDTECESESKSESEVDCSDCADGSFLVNECNEDDEKDRECASCEDECGDGNDDCISDGDEGALCKACAPGKQVADANGDGYGKCETVSEEKESDEDEDDSVNCGACPEGEYVHKECRVDEGKDRKCEPCSDVCGEGVMDCVAYGEKEAHCKECNIDSDTPHYVFDKDGDGYGECKSCSPCGSGEYLAEPCSGTTDNVCKTCSECSDGEEMVEACSDEQDTQCKSNADKEEDGDSSDSESVDCSDCGEGQFLLSACGDETDRECGDCEDACGEGIETCISDGSGSALCPECVEGKILKPSDLVFGFGTCEDPEEEDSSDADADDAIDCGSCPDGEYLSKECDEDVGEARECKACSERCGEGVMECLATGDGDAHCNECNFDTEIPLYIEDRDGDGWGECKFCSPCREGEFLETACSGTQDNVCRECSECADDESLVEACTATEDTMCVSLVLPGGDYGEDEVDEDEEEDVEEEKEESDGPCRPCGEGEFLSKECDGDEERQCKACSERCGEGIMECLATGDGDAHCKECNFDTEIPLYIEDRDGDGWGECKFCSPCREGEFLETACSGTQDNVCRECSDCENGEVLEECSETEDTKCSQEADDEDTSCSCEEGFYLVGPCDEDGNKQCEECRTCDDDEFESKECDSNALEGGNRECSGPQEAAAPEVTGTINADGELEVTFSFGSDDGNFDDFVIVYEVSETVDADDVKTPECEVDSSVGGTVVESDDVVLKLDSGKPWSFAVVTCPQRDNEAFKTSDTSRTTISACGCEDGEYEAVPCAEGQLASCELCDKCGEGGLCKGPNYDDCTKCGDEDFYLDASDSTGLGACRRCLEECASDEYIVSECSETSDMVCERCSPECDDDEVEVVPCTKTEDRICLSKDQAVAPAPVIDASRTRYGDSGRLSLYLTLPKPLSFDDFYIAYAWRSSGDLEDALPAMCGEDDSEIVNVINEEEELRRDEDWIVLSAITCPRPGTAAVESSVFKEAFSACYCKEGFFVSSPCEAGEQLAECSPCKECADGEEEVGPCEGSILTGGDRVCAAVEKPCANCATCTLGGECSECEPGFFLLDAKCKECSECGDDESIEKSCSPASDGHDTICKALPADAPLAPDAAVVPIGKWGLLNDKPHMRLDVKLAPGVPGFRYTTEHNVMVANSYEEAAELAKTMKDPSCDADQQDLQLSSDDLREMGGAYAWLAVKAITCPKWKGTSVPESKVSTTITSACSCAPGEMPSSSCDLLTGTSAVCKACPAEGCPDILPPPVLIPTSVIASQGTKSGTVKIYSSPGTVIAYTDNMGVDVNAPCDSSNSKFKRSTEPVASLELPAGQSTIIQAVACPGSGANSDALSYVLTTAVTVTPAFDQDSATDAAVVEASSLIELDLDKFQSGLPEAALLDSVGQKWAQTIQSLFAENGTDVKVAVTSVATVAAPSRSLRRRVLQTGSRLQVNYSVMTKAEEARAVDSFLEENVADGKLPVPFNDAKVVTQSADLKCSLEHSSPCQIEWWGGTDSRCLPNVLPSVECGKLMEGIVLQRPGICGAPCDESCTASGSCTQVEPCPDCECGLGCGTGSGVAVSQKGPQEKDKPASGSTIREPVEALSSEEEGSTPVTQKWWLWVIVGIAVVGVLAGVGFALLVRRRKAAKEDNASSDGGGDSSPNFVFSTAYEAPRDSTRDDSVMGDMKGYTNPLGDGGIGESQVHVHTNGRGAFGMDMDGSGSSEMSDHFRNDMI